MSASSNTLVFALLHLGVGHVADQGEVEGTVLGDNASASERQGCQQQRAKMRPPRIESQALVRWQGIPMCFPVSVRSTRLHG